MSPAGHWPQLRAAITAGADAVYFGLTHFSARAKVGFTLEELPEVLDALHERGVRGYITFNTLVFQHELPEAARTIEQIAKAGADALIIQDVGTARLARKIAPRIELHASTQMSITNSEGVRLAQSFGIDRVTLARELSLEEVGRIYRETGCPLEIFVHGALCVAYSGQCFSSEAWGGRSANRGQCAQACRLPYELIVDGSVEPLADARYLLSPGDLYALEQVPEIVRSGVSALKIEGRYKDVDYVTLVTRAYRDAVDAAWAGQEHPVNPAERIRLEQVYSRGFGPHFLSGTNHQTVVKGRAPRHRGVLVGSVVRVEPPAVIVLPSEAAEIAPLKAGDGVVFDAASWRSPEEPEEGGRVYEARYQLDDTVELRFANRALDLNRIRTGDLLWRTHDPDIDRAVASVVPSRQRVSVGAVANENEPLRTEWQLEREPSCTITVASEAPLSRAQNRGLTTEMLRDQFGRLGGTPYELGAVNVTVEGNPFVPASVLNQMRREAVDRLGRLQRAQRETDTADAMELLAAEMQPLHREKSSEEQAGPHLHVLVRTAEQLEAAVGARPASITLDYLDLYGLRPSVERVKASGVEVRVASPRILKPGESRIQQFLLSLDCAIVVRSAGMLEQFAGKAALIADFSLNVANSLTAEAYLSMGVERITPTHDLNAAQISDLAKRLGPGRVEVIAYHHLPVFHTEHCVFCRFLSKGTTYKDCGRPCEKHQVALKDQHGRQHPVVADVGCRNTVFGAEAQQGSSHLAAWLGAGVQHFRLEFVHETAEEVRDISSLWHDALARDITPSQLNRELRRTARSGTTEGSLFVPADYLTLPILQ